MTQLIDYYTAEEQTLIQPVIMPTNLWGFSHTTDSELLLLVIRISQKIKK